MAPSPIVICEDYESKTLGRVAASDETKTKNRFQGGEGRRSVVIISSPSSLACIMYNNIYLSIFWCLTWKYISLSRFTPWKSYFSWRGSLICQISRNSVPERKCWKRKKRFHVWYVSLKKRFLGHLLYLIAIKIAYNINLIFTKKFKPFVQGDFNKFLQ